MTQGFDEYQKSDSAMCMNNDYNRKIYEAGAASRQAEINALSALGEMSEQKIDDLVLRNIELKKRIDDALDYVFGLYCTGDLDTERLENILKGESNE